VADDAVGRYTPLPEDNPDWKRHTIPIDSLGVGPGEAPYKCYHIQVDYIPLLLGLLDYYSYADSFVGSSVERELSAAHVNELRTILMTGNLSCGGEVEMRLRQKPTDPCVWQASYDGGATWTDIFDNSLCAMSVIAATDPTVVVSFTQWQQLVVDLNEVYDGTQDSVAPTMEYDAGPNDEHRDLAKCIVIQQIVDAVGAANAGILDDLERLGWEVGLKILQIKKYLLVIGTGLAAKPGVGVPIIDEVMFALLAYLTEQDIEHWETVKPKPENWPVEVQNAILCYALDRVGGDTMEEADFKTMFDGVSSVDGVDSDDEKILASYAQETELFLVSIDAMEEFVAELIAGDLSAICPCSEWYVKVNDFEAVPNVSAYGFIGGAGEFGGSGTLVGNDNGSGDNIRLHYYFTMPTSFHLTKIRVEYTGLNLSDVDSHTEAKQGNYTYYVVLLPAEGSEKDITKYRDADGETFVLTFDTGLTDGDVEITELEMWGAADNPFD